MTDDARAGATLMRRVAGALLFGAVWWWLDATVSSENRAVVEIAAAAQVAA